MDIKISGLYYFGDDGTLMVRLRPYKTRLFVACPVFEGNPPCRGLGCLAGEIKDGVDLGMGDGCYFGCAWVDRPSVKIETYNAPIFIDKRR